MSYQSNPHLKEACDSEIYSLIYSPHGSVPGIHFGSFTLVQRYHPVGSYDSARWIEDIYPLLVTQYASSLVYRHHDFLKFLGRHDYPEFSSRFPPPLLFPLPEKITVRIPPKTTCSVTYLRNQGRTWYRGANLITIYRIVRENPSNSESQTVEIELIDCVMNSVEIVGGTIIGGNHPNLLLSDLSSFVSNYCSQWKNFNEYVSTEWANHYEIIQLVKEAVVTGTGGGENFNPGKWHYETIIWGGLWEKTVVVWDELPSGGSGTAHYMNVWRVSESWGTWGSPTWRSYPLDTNPICIIYASNDYWDQKFPVKENIGDLALSSSLVYKIEQSGSEIISDVTVNFSSTIKTRAVVSRVDWDVKKLDDVVAFPLHDRTSLPLTYPIKYWKPGDSTHLASGFYYVFDKPIAFTFDPDAAFAVSFNEVFIKENDDGSVTSYISFSTSERSFPIWTAYPREAVYFDHKFIYHGLTMINTVEILEIHAALNAGQYGRNPLSPDQHQPRRWNLGSMIHAIAVSQGLNFNANGEAMAPDNSVEYDDGAKVYNRYGTNQAGIAWNNKDAKGKDYGELVPFIGYLYDVITGKIKVNEFTGEASDLDTGGMVGCPNVPAIIEAFKRDVMKALGGDDAVGVVPSADGLGYGVYEGLADMLSEDLYMSSYNSMLAMKAFINSQKGVGMLQEVLRGQGLALEDKEFNLVLNNVPVTGIYPGLSGASPSQTDIALLLLLQLAMLVPTSMSAPVPTKKNSDSLEPEAT